MTQITLDTVDFVKLNPGQGYYLVDVVEGLNRELGFSRLTVADAVEVLERVVARLRREGYREQIG